MGSYLINLVISHPRGGGISSVWITEARNERITEHLLARIFIASKYLRSENQLFYPCVVSLVGIKESTFESNFFITTLCNLPKN